MAFYRCGTPVQSGGGGIPVPDGKYLKLFRVDHRNGCSLQPTQGRSSDTASGQGSLFVALIDQKKYPVARIFIAASMLESSNTTPYMYVYEMTESGATILASQSNSRFLDYTFPKSDSGYQIGVAYRLYVITLIIIPYDCFNN